MKKKQRFLQHIKKHEINNKANADGSKIKRNNIGFKAHLGALSKERHAYS